MRNFMNLLEKQLDFHLVLALIAIFGVAISLSLQFHQANTEFEILNASIYSVVRSQERDLRENASVDQELNELGKLLDELDLN